MFFSYLDPYYHNPQRPWWLPLKAYIWWRKCIATCWDKKISPPKAVTRGVYYQPIKEWVNKKGPRHNQGRPQSRESAARGGHHRLKASADRRSGRQRLSSHSGPTWAEGKYQTTSVERQKRQSQGQPLATRVAKGNPLDGNSTRFGCKSRNILWNGKRRPVLESVEDHASAHRLGDEPGQNMAAILLRKIDSKGRAWGNYVDPPLDYANY